MNENINKVWGERRRVHLDRQNEIDLLYVKKNCFCSTHKHQRKANKFVVISGHIRIETEFGHIDLKKNESWVVYPPMKHRFFAIEDSTMIEFAFVDYSFEINPDDIERESQGGRIIDGKEMTLDEMREKGLLDL